LVCGNDSGRVAAGRPDDGLETTDRRGETMQNRRVLALAASLLVTLFPGCRALEQRPSDEEIVALVKASPPAPPTIGPTYLAEVERVRVEERGDYEATARYWPVRVRVKGGARVRVTNVFQLGLIDEAARSKTQSVEFVEDARFSRDDFGDWQVTYDYSSGPLWRLEGPHRPPLSATPQQPSPP
jgi:hypothetical protein